MAVPSPRTSQSAIDVVSEHPQVHDVLDDREPCSHGEAQHRGVDRKTDLPAPEEDRNQHQLQRLLDDRTGIAHQRGGRRGAARRRLRS